MPEKKIPLLAAYPDVTPEMVEALQVFVDLVDPGLFRNQLVNLYMKYLISEPEELPEDFTDMTESLYFFLEFLTQIKRGS